METVYKKYRPAHEILMEYYWYVDHILQEEQFFKEEISKWQSQADKLYSEFQEAAENERKREENSKSAKLAKKLEQMRLTNDLVGKIKSIKQTKKR